MKITTKTHYSQLPRLRHPFHSICNCFLFVFIASGGHGCARAHAHLFTLYFAGGAPRVLWMPNVKIIIQSVVCVCIHSKVNKWVTVRMLFSNVILFISAKLPRLDYIIFTSAFGGLLQAKVYLPIQLCAHTHAHTTHTLPTMLIEPTHFELFRIIPNCASYL